MRIQTPIALLLSASAAANPVPGDPDWVPAAVKTPEQILAEYELARERGEHLDTSLARPLPEPPRIARAGCTPCVTNAQIFQYEDSSNVLDGEYTVTQLYNLLANASNALIATHGDNFDFIAFWVSFPANEIIGAAWYQPIFNDITGIGTGQYNLRPVYGINSTRVQGWVMMWNIDSPWWAGGADSGTANVTRLVLAQEFEHRFAMFLPPLLDGRVLQGEPGCGRVSHWNFRVDGQGSGMEIAQWNGSNPAIRNTSSTLLFNTDIPGSVFSYPDLYLMGYVSPQEMDTNMSELRYMDAACTSPYFGTVSSFDSSDIIAAAGPRVPDHTAAQKHFRAGWIMIHQPGTPPTTPQLNKATSILAQQQIDWAHSTLNRGTLDNTIFDDCDCDGIPDDAPCSEADLALPYFTLDFFDVLAYLTLFDAQDPAADLAAPFGTFDFFDVLGYLFLFDQGCP